MGASASSHNFQASLVAKHHSVGPSGLSNSDKNNYRLSPVEDYRMNTPTDLRSFGPRIGSRPSFGFLLGMSTLLSSLRFSSLFFYFSHWAFAGSAAGGLRGCDCLV